MANVNGATRHGPDTARELIYKKRAHQFHNKLQEEFKDHTRTMALTTEIAKAGKGSARPIPANFNSGFPVLAGLR
jgi:hypothetical protein